MLHKYYNDTIYFQNINIKCSLKLNSDLDDSAYREFLSKYQFCDSFARNGGYFLSIFYFSPEKLQHLIKNPKIWRNPGTKSPKLDWMI